jgi:hypothetical protein
MIKVTVKDHCAVLIDVWNCRATVTSRGAPSELMMLTTAAVKINTGPSNACRPVAVAVIAS